MSLSIHDIEHHRYDDHRYPHQGRPIGRLQINRQVRGEAAKDDDESRVQEREGIDGESIAPE